MIEYRFSIAEISSDHFCLFFFLELNVYTYSLYSGRSIGLMFQTNIRMLKIVGLLLV